MHVVTLVCGYLGVKTSYLAVDVVDGRQIVYLPGRLGLLGEHSSLFSQLVSMSSNQSFALESYLEVNSSGELIGL